jgi:hypothetical protein
VGEHRAWMGGEEQRGRELQKCGKFRIVGRVAQSLVSNLGPLLLEETQEPCEDTERDSANTKAEVT